MVFAQGQQKPDDESKQDSALAAPNKDTDTAAPVDTAAPSGLIIKCGKCQMEMEKGYLEDIVAAHIYTLRKVGTVVWHLVTSKGAKHPPKPYVQAYRCPNCGHIELYAN